MPSTLEWRLTQGIRCVLMIAACSPRSDRRDGASAGPVRADTLVPSGDPRLAHPSDVAVGPDGSLFLTDQGTNQVVVLSPAGAEQQRIGREGAGPGELRQPRSLTILGDSLWLADVGNDRISVYSTSGAYGRSYGGLPALMVAGVAFDARGNSLLARHGLDGSLAQRFSPTGVPGNRLGQANGRFQGGFDFGQPKADLVGGRVPDALLDYSAPALDTSGGAWVLLIVAGRVQRYTRADSLAWEVALPDSVADRLRDGLFAATRRDTIPNHFPFPNLFVATRAVGQRLWILLQSPEADGALLAELDSAGTWRRYLRVRDASNIRAFAIDPTSGMLFLLDPAEGTLLKAPLPAS